jgi:N-acetylglucosaminyldiphosphoundecaprenol N-acetyl-beta-D-mannosaminyltransferase
MTPDGVSVLAAVKYLEMTMGKRDVEEAELWFAGGWRNMAGTLGETVTGVYLFEALAETAAKRDWKIFLLGGWNEVAERSTQILLERFPGLRMEYDAGEQWVGADAHTNRRVIEKINKFKPDILFVAYNPVKQEKWIYNHRKDLKVGVAVRIGGHLTNSWG